MPSIRKRAALQRDVFNALQRDVFNALQRDVFKKTDVSGRVLRFSFAYFDHSDGELCPAAGQQEGKLFLPQMYADVCR